MTVFEVAFPFLGVTVTVILQDPVLRPLRVVPDTLQYFAYIDTTFRETFDVEAIVILAYAAIDLAVADLEVVSFGMVTLGVVVVMTGA